MSRNINRRKLRNFLIHPGFQLRLVLINCMFVLFVVMMLVAVLFSPMHYEIHASSELWSQYVLGQFMLNLMDRVAVVVLVIIVVSTIYLILFSHRLCGPLVNINHTLDSLSRGDLTRKVFLRRKDFLKNEADNINSMLASLNKKIGMLKEIQINLSSLASQLPDSQLEDRLRVLIQENQALLDEWKVESGDSKMVGPRT